MITIERIRTVKNIALSKASEEELAQGEAALVFQNSPYIWLGSDERPLFVAGIFQPSILDRGELWVLFTPSFIPRLHMRPALRLFPIVHEQYSRIIVRASVNQFSGKRLCRLAGFVETTRTNDYIEYEVSA